MNYISFIDILGTKNSSENENFEDYLELITNFQQTLIAQSFALKENGRVHFFSDCAYIETNNIILLVEYLKKLRSELLELNIFIRGSIINGVLGAISGIENEKYFHSLYNNDQLLRRFKQVKAFTSKHNMKTINGTMFLSHDVSRAFFYENSIKASAIFVEESLYKHINNYIVPSGFIRDLASLSFVSFYDIKYDDKYITEEFLNNILDQYTISNVSDVSYGRYYLSILLTCINSTDFSTVDFNPLNEEFLNAPAIFTTTLNLRKSHSNLYENTKGLEFLYFKLIDKVYTDMQSRNNVTKHLLKILFQNRRYLSKYKNKLSSISKEIISIPNRNLLLKDYNDLLREKSL